MSLRSRGLDGINDKMKSDERKGTSVATKRGSCYCLRILYIHIADLCICTRIHGPRNTKYNNTNVTVSIDKQLVMKIELAREIKGGR